MAATLSIENLAPRPTQAASHINWLQLLVRMEAWLDGRASRHALYALDERSLADLGLSQADAERINEAS